MWIRPLLLAALACAVLACEDQTTTTLGDAAASDATVLDATPGADAGPLPDATAVDAGAPSDAAPSPDAEMMADATPMPDAEVTRDAEPTDASSDAGTTLRGTCTSSADCNGEPCLVLPASADGWHTCAAPLVPEATSCQAMGLDACCDSSTCTAGTGGCYEGPLFYCGGAHPQPANVCLYDECQRDADCGGAALCVPARAFGEVRAHCVPASCKLDVDCTSSPGGRCVPFFSPCTRRLDQFACTYDPSECRSDADCSSVQFGYCAPGEDGRTSCEQFIPPP